MQRDTQLINSGTHFWCSGHLSAIRISERSAKDPRYCNACQSIIESSYKELGQGYVYAKQLKKAANTPVEGLKTPLEGTPNRTETPLLKPDGKTHTGILSHRGRSKIAVPKDKILELSAKGIPSRSIASRLAVDGINVSYRTVSRVLQTAGVA